MTSSVSGKRSPAELIAPVWRWRRESNPCARLCRPLPHHSATPPLGLMPVCTFRADDGIRTRDPHLGKVMRYQLRYIREPWARSSPTAKFDNSARTRSGTNPCGRIPYRPYSAEMSLRANLRPRQVATVRCARRSRGSVGERPLHTRKVAGSIPAGTTTKPPLDGGLTECRCSAFIQT